MARQKMSFSHAPLLEWIAGGVGVVLLFALLGTIGYDAVSGASQEVPEIVVEAGGSKKIASGHVVAFRAVNLGGGTAAAVEIEGQLLDGERVIETSSATIDYLPGHGSAEGGLFYLHDPRGLIVQARPLGYQAP